MTIEVPLIDGPADGRTVRVSLDHLGEPVAAVEMPDGSDWPERIGVARYRREQLQGASGPTWAYRYEEDADHA